MLDISCPKKILNFANKAAILCKCCIFAGQITLMMSSPKHINVLEKNFLYYANKTVVLADIALFGNVTFVSYYHIIILIIVIAKHVNCP